MIGWIILGVVGFLVLMLILWLVGSYNGLVRKRNDVEEGFSTMDVYMKKRYDLVPNLVETVKGYAKHEKDTLQNVVAARSMAMGAGSIEDRVAGETALTNTLKSLFAVSEAYPDLKADAGFRDLQRQLQELEVHIAKARKFYNAVVKTYNNKVETVPSNIVANMFGFKRRPMFEVATSSEREAVKVSF